MRKIKASCNLTLHNSSKLFRTTEHSSSATGTALREEPLGKHFHSCRMQERRSKAHRPGVLLAVGDGEGGEGCHIDLEGERQEKQAMQGAKFDL